MLYRSRPPTPRPLSPSPRRAWIEMTYSSNVSWPSKSRPPHGRLSLKYEVISSPFINLATVFFVLRQQFLDIKTAPCSQIQDAAIIGLQYSKTSMLYARQLKSIIDIYSLSPFFHLLCMIFCIFSNKAMFQIFRSIRRKIYRIIFFHNNRAGTNFTAFLKTLWKNHGIAINVRPPVYHLFHQLPPKAIYCFNCFTLLLRSKIKSIQIFYRDWLLALQRSIKYYTFLLRPFIHLLPIFI